jgi:hypothetical protein
MRFDDPGRGVAAKKETPEQDMKRRLSDDSAEIGFQRRRGLSRSGFRTASFRFRQRQPEKGNQRKATNPDGEKAPAPTEHRQNRRYQWHDQELTACRA